MDYRKQYLGRCLSLLLALAGLGSPALLAADRTINVVTLRDKIKGGWVGHMAGTAWGASTEFGYLGSIMPDNEVPTWSPSMVNDSFDQDDLYVAMPFVRAVNDNGVNCNWTKFGDYFRDFTPQLWHANLVGRMNLRNGFSVPDSGHYSRNQHCDDIDWQIESNFAGIMAPGQPNAAAELAWRGGHTMNYGDGVYGGVVVAAMHAEAYFATNIDQVIEAGRQAIPLGSKYRQVLEDVIAWKGLGQTWEQNWQSLETKWGGDDRCPDGVNDPFNIDAKLNGAYILLGLLYGGGNFETSMRIAMRCGQDSDCNPGSVGAVLGTYFGFANIPSKFTSALSPTSRFSGTTYTVDDVSTICETMARQALALTGGSTSGSGTNETWTIPMSAALPLILEQWPTNANTPPAMTATLVARTNLTVTLNATATDADGIYGYQWFLGDMTFTNGAVVTHTYRQPGVYPIICYVADNIGNTAYRVMMAYIETNAPVITQQPTNQNVPTGGTASFTLVATSATPLSYQWQKDNSNLSDGGHYSGATTSTLNITGADSNDAASYRCVVTNIAGSTTSSHATLAVTISLPTITQQPANQSVDTGGTASFTVLADGSQPLAYRWQRSTDGSSFSNLSDSGHYSGSTTTTLTITGADAGDAASYRCAVTNAYGSTNSASATLTVNLNVCIPSVLLRHGDMEDATSYSVCPDWNSYSAGNGTASWAKELATVHGGLAAQKCRNPNGGTGSLLGVRQTFDANIGDAFTFDGWVRPASNPGAGQQVAMVAMWNGATANPTTGSGTWKISTGFKEVWTHLQNLSGNATATNVTLFLDSRRTASSQDLTAYWDDVISYRAYLPPAPLVSRATSTSLSVDVLPGCNVTNGAAQFAISVGGGGYTLGTHWVQASGTVGTTTFWQSEVAWAARTVTGLATGTPYTFKVQARYSSTVTQPTSLGAGTTLAPQAPQPPQLLAQRDGTNLTVSWPESTSGHLERAGSLSQPLSWFTDTNQVTIAGGQKRVTITPAGGGGYYRLVLE
jgi:hypothetical protein